MQWLIDLDGVVWLLDEPIAGGSEAVKLIEQSGCRPLFVTNNSTLTRAEYVQKLSRFGIAACEDQIITSSVTAGHMLSAQDRVMVVGEPALLTELGTSGASVFSTHDCSGEELVDVVVVGFDRQFCYADMTAATVAIRGGARFIATNRDPTYPLSNKVIPGTGALVASVVAATGVTPEFAGKPDQAMVDVVTKVLVEPAVMVGDRTTTDGLFAKKLGAKFVHVASGIADKPDNEIVVDVTAATLLEAVRRVLEEMS